MLIKTIRIFYCICTCILNVILSKSTKKIFEFKWNKKKSTFDFYIFTANSLAYSLMLFLLNVSICQFKQLHSLTAVILYVWLKTVIELFLLLPFLEPFSRVHNSISITTVKYTFFLQRIQIFFALKLDRSENHFVFSLMEINNFRACNHFLFPFFQKRIRGDSVKMKETITILKKYQI